LTRGPAGAKFAPVDREDIRRLADEGRLEEARAAYERELRRAGHDLELLADAADLHVGALQQDETDLEALERGRQLARRGAALARRTGDRELEAELLLLEASALSQLGDCRGALARLDAALAIAPDSVDAQLERGSALYELGRLDEARSAVEGALARAPDDPWAQHLLGLLAERQGLTGEAERRFARAHRLAPEDFPEPVRLSPGAFDEAVERALAEIPPVVRRYLANVPITVEELPSDEDLRASDPPLSPSILGLFRGAAYGEKGSDPWSHLPSSIVLYQRNLERFARDRAELAEQIGVTLVHEVGHFLGLDEEELYDRGLD
jgi:predicted Zn-dependent protease with MMP-like domain